MGESTATMASSDDSFMPVSDPTLVQAHVRDLIRSFESAKGSNADQLATARSLYELAIFSKNRKITLEANGLSVVSELLRSSDEDVRAYGLSTCAALAADGADACAALREIEYKYAVVKGDETVWESGFIRKFKMSSERMQQIEDTWEGVEGLEDYAPGRNRAATEQLP